ncbi:regulatory protein, luxR family [Thermomonospora echinospora]|uniref:Regulatory protein, luxR family n=1 Tax=Thermomonospora echinospora TaxID=1992 RepID=A0A1H6CM97_9ACTN|nr:helix-turn-helix transcriptional regulator [Thermomonospora echinospora]SEG74091.1 regulatory protein, luxR family [Thermomonospora echinospora]
MFIGREPERERVARLLVDARSGRSGALVIRGEAGIGKTALLDHVAAQAGDMRLLRGVGIEAEAELPFSGLHLLLHPFTDRFDVLPGRQAAALRSAFGLADEPAGDRFLIAAATLTLLSELAADRPLLCLVDDAQWLDRASSEALFFAARRLRADPICMVFAVRDTAQPFEVPGVQALRLGGLERACAVELLDAHLPGLAVPVRERLLEEAAGNPLALIELADALKDEGSPAAHPIGPLRVTGRIQETYRGRLGELPPPTRLLLLVAAAGTTDLGVVLRAAELLGASAADLGPAEEARLVVLSGDEIRFRHPLIRAVTYQDAPHHQRIAVHGALARALPGDEHADRRAWHLAAAATGPDEDVAAELERAARRAAHRGGTAAVAAAYERAARLSTESGAKARRIVSAARAAYDAGQPDRATRLATEAASLTDEPAVVAEATYIRAQVEYERTSPAADAALALEGATLIARSDPERAVSMLTEAVWSARDACAHDLVRRSVELLQAVRLPPGSALAPVAAGLIGYGHLVGGAAGQAVAPMRALVRAARAGEIEDFVERVIAGFAGLLSGDDEDATAVLESLAADARGQGALGWLPYVLEPLAIGRLLRGDLRGARADVAEGTSLAADIGMDMQVTVLDCISVWLEAVAGDETRCRSLADDVLEHATLHPTNAALASWGLGLLDLAAGRTDQALERLDEVCGGPARYDLLIRAVPDHVEAAVRSGRADLAARHLPALRAWAEHTGGPAATSLLLRCRALLSPGDEAGEYYSAALDGYRDGDHAYDAARTRLVYGEWLRRRRRRSEARDQLAQARDAFLRLGAAPWAERAQAELEVLGDRPIAQTHDTDLLKRLTPQELQVVRLAAAGYSNREIGAQLYLSPRTVGHHLYKAFPKIGVTRRMELTQLEL